jgi:dihydrofolate reductase
MSFVGPGSLPWNQTKERITMAKLRGDISISLDGFVAGPNPSLEEPLGEGGNLLHEWAFAAQSWRESHGLEGGDKNADSEVIQESIDATGAVVMGRRMFSGGKGAWENDPRARGWWGDDPPFHVPVFVLTHHPREALVMQGGTTFTYVTDGIEAAVDQARSAAGDEDVLVAGGASVVQQCLLAGLLDELQIHVVPALLGNGTSLFDRLDIEPLALEATRVIASPSVTHLRFSVPKRTA